MSLISNIALDDKGDPKLHAHTVVGKSDSLRRTMRGEFGLPFWIWRYWAFPNCAHSSC